MNPAEIFDFFRSLALTFLANLRLLFSTSTHERCRNRLSEHEVLINLVACLGIGIVLQDVFISAKGVSTINWFDRMVIQLFFWSAVFLVAAAALRMLGGKRPTRIAAKAIFIIMPTAFMCGAYASGVGYFVRYIAENQLQTDALLLPHWFNIIVQTTIVLIYLPREFRYAGEKSRIRCISAGIITYVFVLAVDVVMLLLTGYGMGGS